MRRVTTSDTRRLRGWKAAIFVLFTVAACGSAAPPRSTDRSSVQMGSIDQAARFATGPIQQACVRQKRRTMNAGTCGCLQAAADISLSPSEQRLGAQFFQNPELLQEIKLSDTPNDERFWYTWEAFAETAQKLCRSS